MSQNKIPLKSIQQLLTEARSEFKENSPSMTGPSMSELTRVFDAIAHNVYGNQFLWSEYNKSQWEKFVSGCTSWCGACAFSAEANGGVPDVNGFGLGGVNGPHPFHLWDLYGRFGPEPLRAAVAGLGKYSLECIG